MTPDITLLLIATALSVVLIIYAWRRRTAIGTTTFAILMLAVGGWSLIYALELISITLATKLFWVRVEYIFIVAVPVTWLAFALQYARGAWLTRRNLLLLSIIPIITLIFVWTNNVHQLMWTQPQLSTSGPFLAIDKTYGAWFWVHLVYTYILLLLGTLLLIRMLITSSHLYRWQAGLMLLGVSIPWIVNIITITGLSPIPGLDLTPFAFTLSGIAFGWAVFRFRLLDVVPFARRVVADSMPEGVIVLDTQNRLVDNNRAAHEIVGCDVQEGQGQHDTELF